MSDSKNGFGYEIVDDIPTTASKYLSFRKGDKGKTIQIRLVSEPRYILQHWIMGDNGKQTPVNCIGEKCPYCGKDVPPKEKLPKIAKWGWIVIDREDAKIKIFTGPTLIARSIKEISELKDMRTKKLLWGNPLLYDIQITRTEEPGASYYKVVPIGVDKGELTKEEKKVVADTDYNLEEELKGAKKSKNTGSYTEDLETVPDDKVSDEKGIDDIPF